MVGKLFQPQKELINYDYFDIADGIGYVVYYGLIGDNQEPMLATTSSIYSEEICSVNHLAIQVTFTKGFDKDFDLKFNRPKNIKGVIIVNVPIGIAADNTGGTHTYEYYAKVLVYHYDGSTETLIGTGQSLTVVIDAAHTLDYAGGAFNSIIAACKIDVNSIVHFKKGEILRFTIEAWFKATTGVATEYTIVGHDPQNREFKLGNVGGSPASRAQFANEQTGGGATIYQKTQMIFHVPFIIDI